MITLKIVKPFALFMTSKTQTERFVGKWQIDNFGTHFCLENKDLTKAEIEWFSFLRRK